jgi:membrane peptidoglycan carboxypeptidase
MKVSLNTAFDGLANDIGPASVAATAYAAGIPKTHNGQPTLASADGKTAFGIGIGDYPVRPLDQAVGFGTFAAGGVAHAGYLVQSVTDADGNVLYKHKDAGKRVLDPRVANDVALTLEPIAGFSDVGLSDRPSAAKTGTEGILSGKDAGQNSDAWMVGYTPQVSTAVWVGSGDSTHAIYNAAGDAEYGRDLPGRTWKLFMDTYLANKAAQPLPSTQQIFSREDAPSTPAPPTTPSTHTLPPTHPSTPSTHASTPRTTTPPTLPPPASSTPPTTPPTRPTTPVAPP